MALMIIEQQTHASVTCRMYVYSALFRSLYVQRTRNDQTGINRCGSAQIGIRERRPTKMETQI